MITGDHALTACSVANELQMASVTKQARATLLFVDPASAASSSSASCNATIILFLLLAGRLLIL
jgi:magnesium-transporting ATPase (P-type)